ncbi:MAG: hypothetical protein JWP25_1981 [Bradyrhizobium sp.]|nr:hypothetical protein [Bradyrhizobium sp.]MEA2867484.1 hypothetical protein [Bradyrhizobium sp.]
MAKVAKDSDQRAGSFENENTGGLLTGFLAEEEHFDRRGLLRLGTWGAASVGAVIVAILANQSSMRLRRDEVAAVDLTRQSQQIQSVAKESQNETRRLAAAIDTLNGDRDRLYSRVTVLEQGLDSVTGAIARQSAAAASPQATSQSAATAAPQPAAQNPTPPPVVTPVATTVAAPAEKPRAEAKPPEPSPATVASVEHSASEHSASTAPAATPATPLMASKSMMAPPDAAAGKLIEPEAPAKAVTAAPLPAPVAEAVAPVPVASSAPPADNAGPDAQATPPKLAVQRTEFGVDVGGANSVGGLRALWRGLLKSRSNAPLAALHPIIVVKEGSNGLGMQLRLVAGPLGDAAAAAKICAVMNENERTCETAVFDGQRLAMRTDDAPASADQASAKSTSAKSTSVKPDPIKSDLTKSDSAKSDSAKSDSAKSDPIKSDPIKPDAAKSASSAKPASTRQYSHHRSYPKKPAVVVEEPKKPEPTTLSSFFGRR